MRVRLPPAAVRRARNPLRGEAEIALKVGAVVNRHKVAKHFELSIGEASFSFHRKTEAIAAEAALDGVMVLRTSDDAAQLRQRVAVQPRRVLVIGGGFTGSEIASVCREIGLAVTVAERGPAPLAGALGAVIGGVAASLQRDHGVDLRCGVSVTQLEGDARGRLRRAHLSDGSTLDVEVAVAALGVVRDIDWLRNAGLAATSAGLRCDTGCRAYDPFEKIQIHAVPGQKVEAMIACGPGSPGGPASDWRVRSVNVSLIEPARRIRCGQIVHHGHGLPVCLDGWMVRVAVVQRVNVSA